MAEDRAVEQERVVLRVILPGGGRCTGSASGPFEPRQIRALVRMLEVTAEVIADAGDDESTADPARDEMGEDR